MAVIRDNPNASGLGVDLIPRAARGILYNAAGQRITSKHNQARDAINDEAFVMGGINDGNIKHVRLDRMGNIGTTRHNLLFQLNIDGATLHSSLVASAATMVNVISTGGGIQMNSGSSVAINTYSILTTRRQFQMPLRGPLLGRWRKKISKGSTNSACDFGFGSPSTNAILQIGAYWALLSDGSLRPCYAYNNAPVTGADISGLIDSNTTYIWDVIIHDDSLQFSVQNPATGLIINEQSIKMDTGSLRRFAAANRLPAFSRVYNAGVAPAAATQMVLGDWYVGGMDIDMGRSVQDTQGSLQMSLLQNPSSGLQLEQFANNSEPANATLSNTAQSYSAAGGRFQFIAPAGIVTDYCLFSYAVPVGYQAKVQGIAVFLKNLGAVSATTPTLIEWGMQVNASAGSLISSGVRKSFGNQSIPVGTLIGGNVAPLVRNFNTPIVCEGGTFMNIIMRIPVGTATASQIIGGTFDIDGYQE
jgi:hypothetical protein